MTDHPPPALDELDADRPLPSPANPKALAATPEVVAALLDQASSVTANEHASGGVRAVEVQLGHFCNNRCVFCASGQLTERGQAQPVPEAQVASALQSAARSGVRRVTFLGGEPTVQDSFLPSLRLAQQLGFDDITIFTNGARIGDRDWLAAALALGRFTWRISIQGGDAASHDLAVGRRGAFARILKGLAWLQQAGQRVEVNVCLTAASLASLPELANVALDFGVQQLCVDMVRPVSAGERSARWMRKILPRFSDVAPVARELVDRLEALDPQYDVALTHLPFCVLPERADRIAHGGDATVTFTADPLDVQGAQSKYEFQASDRTHVPGCLGCVFRPRCSGVPWQYLSLYGDAELQAVTVTELARRDPLARSVVDAWRARIEQVSLPGWRVDSASDARQQRQDWHLWHPNGGLLRARLQPLVRPAPGGWPLVAADGRVGLWMAPDGAVPAAAVLDAVERMVGGLRLAFVADAPADAAGWQRWQRGRRWLDALRHQPQLRELGAVAAADPSGTDLTVTVRPAHAPQQPVVLRADPGATSLHVAGPSPEAQRNDPQWRSWSSQLGQLLKRVAVAEAAKPQPARSNRPRTTA